MTVHPRLRGELSGSLITHITCSGSSPLTRGTREKRVLKWLPPTVHPRLRGELEYQKHGRGFENGSSPLTRGTLPRDLTLFWKRRFIPAYAGNSLKDGINPSIHTLGI